jgi:hypothetical protein
VHGAARGRELEVGGGQRLHVLKIAGQVDLDELVGLVPGWS